MTDATTTLQAPAVVETELTLVVSGHRIIAEGVAEVEFEAADGGNLPPWKPGAHVEFELADGLVRHYSLCGDLSLDRWRVAVLRAEDGRGGSDAMHRLEVGTELLGRGPRHRFELEQADRYEFIAGGIGITPLIPMIDEVDRRGVPWRLAYGGRSRASMAYSDELSRRYGDRVTLIPQDKAGVLDLDRILASLAAGAAVYACGPEGLLTALEQRADGAAWSLHLERFVAGQQEGSGQNEAIEVELVDTGRTVTVAADETILDAMDREGVFVLSSCREGICGTCETRVLAGEPDHRDSYLTAKERDEGDVMMICVSRSRTTKLTLEL
ncbi:PDR/VanB family oxidoreductase [Rhodococcus sp. NPDC057529]|uniref:PDR/VanB family oxidoreductase n=1 Tax=Rhodococcus sp. NPDC057529 TaxID=3346158 RepID=UPI003672443E